MLFVPPDILPSVFRRNLQCEPVKKVDAREECHWSHACQRFKRGKGVKRKGTLENGLLPKNAHRAVGSPTLPVHPTVVKVMCYVDRLIVVVVKVIMFAAFSVWTQFTV
jgi:hypothetical protein